MSGLSGTESSPELSDSGGRALKLQTDTPHLVNIGGDRLSTSVTLHPIPQGRVTLGCGPGVDIRVQGTGVLPLHCHIENSEGVVTIYPLSDNLSVDGVKISRPTRLSQGVMLTIGRSNYMRFNHPAEAKIMKSVLPNPRISMASITFEPDNSFQSKYNKKPPAVPRKNSKESLIESGVEEPVPSSIMTKVSKFEYLAQQNFKKSISPKVFSSNLVTVNTPAKDVLGKSPPDLQNFSKNLPQNALNYSELNYNEKQQIKTSERFGKKSPQYVNVTVSEKKNINNKVIIYENGCIPKNPNLECNELNNKSSSHKNINMNRALTPSPNYNRNPSPHLRCTTPNNCKNETEITENCNDAELKRTQAQQERIKEQEIGKAEQARLEEILNMCVEYEKQAQSEKNKLTPNRIKTNGSLPRDKRQYGPLSPVYTTPPPSPRDVEIVQHENRRNNSSYENISINRDNSLERINANYDNVEMKQVDDFRTTKCNSPYENIVPSHQSPRTRIKTIASSNRDGKSKDTAEIIENKFAILEAEQYLLQNLTINDEKSLETDKILAGRENTKFIFPLEEKSFTSLPANLNATPYNKKPKPNNINDKQKIEKIRKERKEVLSQISSIKRHIAETEIHEEELQRDIELENALISGEHKAKLLELDKLEHRKNKLFNCAQKLEESMSHRQTKQDEDQLKCKEKLELAQENMLQIEGKLAKTPKTDPEYENVFEEYLKAQEILDNEKKAFEDLEFHHLEEEADWLASREEVQREILDLSKKIDSVKDQIQELEQQKYNISKNNNTEVKIIRMRRDEFMRKLEKCSLVLRRIDNELSVFAHQESDQEESTDSDSDKSKDLDKHLSNLSLNVIHDLSCSVIVSNTKTSIDHVYNMSQSFNEKLLQEKSVLETGIGTKCPSQDDIDRISKVTSSAPISINEEQGSLGRKTIESLKDIERKRHLHLCQQGSQVIEQERQRVLALKQRVQHEVRIKWAQSRQDCVVPESGEKRNSVEIVGRQPERPVSKSPTSNEQIRSGSSEADSPRPMSEISEISTDFGEISNKKRTKPHGDKQRPLTRYLPIRGSDLDLRQHIESAGHQVVLCPHVIINSSSCRGFLHKKGSKLNGWSKRWFVFDRNKHTLTYYNDKSEKKARGGAYFQVVLRTTTPGKQLTPCVRRIKISRTPIYLIVRYPRLKVVDMENNRNTGNAGAPPQEMPTWFVRWLNSQQPRNVPNFAAPSTSTAVQRPQAILQVRPSTSAAADVDGWQVTPLPSDGTTSPEPDPEIPVAPEPAPLASPLVQEPGSSTTSATSGAVMASPPMPITTDNVAAISGVLRSLLDRPLPAPERPSFEGLKRQNPVKFLRAIEEYGRFFGLDSQRLLGVAMDCLKGNAKHWTGIFQKKWRGYEDFRRDFLRTYWSAKRQRDIRFQIATGRYDETRGTMLSHFAYYVDMANMLTTPLSEEVLLDELLRHFPERIQSLWVLEKICTTTDAAEFLAAQEIPGQNPGEKTNIAPRERPRATDHQRRNEPKRPRPNIDRHEVTRPAAPANRGNGFPKRSSDEQQWRNNQPSTSNNRWHNNNGNNSNNHWRKNNPNDNRNNTSSRAQGETSRNSKNSGNGGGVQDGA